jgi:hypothetical protein
MVAIRIAAVAAVKGMKPLVEGLHPSPKLAHATLAKHVTLSLHAENIFQHQMPRFLFVALAAAIMASRRGDGRALVASGAVPIRVLSVQADEANEAVSFVLENVGPKAMTAWNVRVQVGTHVGITGVDAWLERSARL